MTKDPKRWADVIIDSPYAKLTKKQVYDFYKTPSVQKRILDSLGKNDVLIRQSFSPGNVILRRKEQGRYIRPSDIKDLIERRLTEIHPVFSKKTDRLVIDVDPQKNVPWSKTKSVSELVAKTLQSHPDIKNVKARFSGNRGFLLEGLLEKEIGINTAHNKAKKILDGIVQRHDVTFGVTKKPDQIRLDLSPLKFRGSYKAEMSLDARTGLVAAPVKIEDIPKVTKSDFTIKKILDKVTKTAKEFAPGIPLSRIIRPIPTVKKPETWQLAVQKHDAQRAGSHYDLRFIPKGSRWAHSFAVPKSRFPTKKDHPFILALEQPTHSKRYSTYTGEIPEGTYGAGKVDLISKEKINVIKANADRLVFERKDGKQRFSLFRTDGNKFGLKRIS